MLGKLRKCVDKLGIICTEKKEYIYDTSVEDYYDRVSCSLQDIVGQKALDLHVDLICYYKYQKYDYVFVIIGSDYDIWATKAQKTILNTLNNIIFDNDLDLYNVQSYVVCSKYYGFGFPLNDVKLIIDVLKKIDIALKSFAE